MTIKTKDPQNMTPMIQKPLWMWGVFLSLVLILLALDLGIFHRRQRAISVRESLTMSGMYVVMSLLFSLWIAHELGAQSANEYLTGFLIEKTLSMDNIFVISLIFSFFKIPLKFQHRVLFWGILGVIFLRGLMIGLGAKLISEFEWVLYIFAIFLIYTGIKMFFVVEETKDFEDNHVLKFFRRHLPITKELHGEKFCVIETNPKTGRLKLFWTPLFLTLIFIEMMDLVFAIDSVPAIFAITTDTYIVYTSNIFAILGLRALYFALAAIIYRFIYLKYALAMVLVFIGSKIFIADALGLEKIPATFSLTVTILLLAGGIVYSLYKTRQEEGEREGER